MLFYNVKTCRLSLYIFIIIIIITIIYYRTTIVDPVTIITSSSWWFNNIIIHNIAIMEYGFVTVVAVWRPIKVAE